MIGAGSRNERVKIEQPATSPSRTTLGHRTGGPDNWTLHANLFCEALNPPHDTKQKLTFVWSTQAAAITTGWRITRRDGTPLHVIHAGDPDGLKEQIVVMAEPA